jgi:hypothetical protein
MYFQPSFLGNLCTNCFGKATLVLLIVFLAIQDISLAILASVVLISSMHLVSREGFKEGNTGIPGRCMRVKDDGTLEKISDNQSECLNKGTCHNKENNSYSQPSLGGDPSVSQSQCDGIGSCTDVVDTNGSYLSNNNECMEHGKCKDKESEVVNEFENNETGCLEAGTCSNTDIKTKSECEGDDSATWTPNNTWTSDNTWTDLEYEWKRHTWDVSTQPDLGCDSYQDHINNENAHRTHSHVNGFRNRKGGKEGFMVSSSELISFEDSKIRGKDSNIYPVSRPSVQNKGLFSGFNLF